MRVVCLALGMWLALSAGASTRAAEVAAALDSLDLADGLYRTAVYVGSGVTLRRAAEMREAAYRVLDEAETATLDSLNWPERIRFMERAAGEQHPDWSRAAVRAWDRDLPPTHAPSRGRAALLLALCHLEDDPESLRVIDPETRRKVLKPGDTPSRRAALEVLEAGAGEPWLLQDEVWYRAHELCLALGDEAGALVWARKLQDLGSPRTGFVRATLARGLLAEGAWQAGVQFLRGTPTEEETSELLALRARAHLQGNEPEEACRVLEKLVGKYPKSPRAMEAYRDRLELASRVPLTREERAFLLVRLLEGYPAAGDSLQALAEDYGHGSPEYLELCFQRAQRAYALKAYDRAESLLVPLAKTDTVWSGRDDARIMLARAYRNTGDLEPMRAQYRVVRAESERYQDTALWELAREEYSQGAWARAESLFTVLLDSRPTASYREGALMNRGFCRYRLGRDNEALEDFAELAQGTVTGEREEQAAYWRARMLDRLGRSAAAERVRGAARSRVVPESYYGVLLWQEAGLEPPPLLHPAPPLGAGETLDGLLDELLLDPGPQRMFLRGVEYARLGMSGEATREFDRLRSRFRRPELVLEQALALAAGTYHVYPFGVSQALRVLARLPADAPERDAYERLVLPPVYAGEVLSLCRERGVDPAAVWSIMRQESLYDAFAVSRAGALGLMQLMPETLVRITQEQDLKPRPADHLFLPRLNLSLGVRFFHDRLLEFDGRLLPALASYNAGEDKVYEWLELAGGQGGPDFIECIGYPETADYVRRIGRMMWLYPAYYPSYGKR